MRRAGIAIYAHIVWATWDRLPLLTKEIEQRVHRAIAAKCLELGGELIALGGIEDHVHMLVGLPARLSLAEFVGNVKGASSHLATHEALPTGAFFKWQGAYGAVSVSPRDLAEVSAYIGNQREHHTTKTLVPDWEHLPAFEPAKAGFAVAQPRPLGAASAASARSCPPRPTTHLALRRYRPPHNGHRTHCPYFRYRPQPSRS